MKKHTLMEVELDGDKTYRLTATTSAIVLAIAVILVCVMAAIIT